MQHDNQSALTNLHGYWLRVLVTAKSQNTNLSYTQVMARWCDIGEAETREASVIRRNIMRESECYDFS